MTTFYSELIHPAELDYENPDTDTLLTCQLDDGTTVTNLITGATGEVFDVVNLIGVAASSGERLSATWTLKPTSIDLDPFSLLKTQAVVNQEYGLKLNTAAQSISIPFIGATTGTVTYTDGTTSALSVTGTYTLTGATAVFLAKITATDNNGFHYFEFNQTKLDTVTSHTSSLVCTLLGLPADSGYVRGTNRQIEGYQFTATTTATLTLTGAYTGLITYADNTTLAISDAVNGLGNYVVNSGIVKSITATDTIKSYNWDATTPQLD